jgi:hypothetical protein
MTGCNAYLDGLLVDGLSGCNIALREMYREAPEGFEDSLRFDHLVKLGRQ